MKMRINIGKYNNKDVVFDRSKSNNGHMILYGATGEGKTTQAVRMMNDMASQGITVLAFDTNNIFADGQITPAYLGRFKKYLNDVDVYSESIKMPLFTPLEFNDGNKEKDVDVVDSVTESMAKTFKFGVRQKATLRTAVEAVYEKNIYQTEGIQSIGRMLKAMKTTKALEVKERVSQITDHNIFEDGEFFIKPGKINILRISKFSEDTQQKIMEIVSAFIWKYATKEKFAKNGLYIVLDEIQNMDLSPSGMISRILVEGRRFNLNLLLSTQIMSQSAQITKRMTQAALIMHFRPAKSELTAVASLIEPGNEKGWHIKLNQLNRGEFVAMGQLEYDNKLVNDPIVVSAKIESIAKGGILDEAR